MTRPVMLFVLLWVVLDFANPLMPGAVRFTAEESVAGVHAERVRPGTPAVTTAPAPSLASPAAAPGNAAVLMRPAPRPSARRWDVALPRARSHVADSPPTPEDA
jgi:hypothetical protein